MAMEGSDTRGIVLHVHPAGSELELWLQASRTELEVETEKVMFGSSILFLGPAGRQEHRSGL